MTISNSRSWASPSTGWFFSDSSIARSVRRDKRRTISALPEATFATSARSMLASAAMSLSRTSRQRRRAATLSAASMTAFSCSSPGVMIGTSYLCLGVRAMGRRIDVLCPRLGEQRQRRAQMPAGAVEKSRRIVGCQAIEHEGGELDPAPGPIERLADLCGIAAGDLVQDRLAAPGELGVGGLHIDHQPGMDPAEPDHGQRGDEAERDALGRAGLDARRPGDRFGACIEPDRMVGRREQRRVGIVGDGDGESAPCLCFFEAANGERRGAAGRHGD
jgi:hypothetical protein